MGFVEYQDKVSHHLNTYKGFYLINIMITYLLNLFNPRDVAFNQPDFHRRNRYCGSHYMLGYLKQNAFKNNEELNDPIKLLQILKKYTISPSNIINKNIDDYRYMTQIFWSEILQEPKHVLPHPHVEWKYKQPENGVDPMKEMHEFLTLNWAIEMAYQKSKVPREDLHQPLIYDLVLKELKESNEIETIKSIEKFQDIIWNNVSGESGKF